MISYGNASGPVTTDLGVLAAKGSLYVTRPTLNTYTAKREDLVATADDLFAVVKSGAVKIDGQPDLPAEGRRRGAPGAGEPEDHRQHRPHPVGNVFLGLRPEQFRPEIFR